MMEILIFNLQTVSYRDSKKTLGIIYLGRNIKTWIFPRHFVTLKLMLRKTETSMKIFETLQNNERILFKFRF